MISLKPFEVTAEGLTLRGTHYLPAESGGPFPTAVLFHGFGGSRVETSGVFVTLARALAARGIGVIAYDRAGHGESDGAFFDTTVSLDVRQAHLVLAAVASLPDVDENDLHIVGMSLGSVIAAVAVAESPLPIKSLTMWSTAAVFVDEIRAGRLQGRSLDTLDTVGYFDFLGMRMGRAMRDDAITFDPYERARGYTGPVQLLHGTEDFVPVSYAEKYLDVYGSQAQLVVVEGADHGWIQLQDRELLIEKTVDFIASHAQKGSTK